MANVQRVGFTGTRNGLTEAQKEALAALLDSLEPDTFHHGDCVGADDEAATIAANLGAMVVCHPPVENRLRAFNRHAKQMRDPKTYFARNRDIVDETDLLIGCPGAPTWRERGGTFYTMDYAIDRRKPVKVIWPDGTVEDR